MKENTTIESMIDLMSDIHGVDRKFIERTLASAIVTQDDPEVDAEKGDQK